ncbi:Os01g0630101 [Oryza sativa Japonica Group]|uniref:Os01g0630101 protein n=1 Tax=Oryza sativa subsp. japonica TaxID=39947 RepID=A0A0P0V5J8_ORYSJ|nr:hypothetical protein EE612_004505 [Oryza sativa]BAS73290.1 Os01g0630101 [Oryza sativa Japonica Group]
MVPVHVDLEAVVHDGRDVVCAAGGREQVRREDGEPPGVVQVEAPVRHRHDHVHQEHVAGQDVGGGKERRDQRAVQEG